MYGIILIFHTALTHAKHQELEASLIQYYIMIFWLILGTLISK